MATLPLSDPLVELFRKSKTIAVVGLSDSPLRPSHGVSAHMQTHGYRIIPVNPKIIEALGEKSYHSLREVPVKIDVVNIFRRSEFVEQIVDDAIQLKVSAIWMQEGITHLEAADKARNAGIFVVMDLCILKEQPRTNAISRNAGINTYRANIKTLAVRALRKDSPAGYVQTSPPPPSS